MTNGGHGGNAGNAGFGFGHFACSTPRTDFATSFGHVPGQAFEFTAKRLPTMGTKQLSRRNVTASSSSSIGMSNVYDIAGGGTEGEHRPGSLRPIVIDGSNVAMAHGEATGKRNSRGEPLFSSRGIDAVVD